MFDFIKTTWIAFVCIGKRIREFLWNIIIAWDVLQQSETLMKRKFRMDLVLSLFASEMLLLVLQRIETKQHLFTYLIWMYIFERIIITLALLPFYFYVKKSYDWRIIHTWCCYNFYTIFDQHFCSSWGQISFFSFVFTLYQI